jgi:hypothetical protein
MRHDATTIGTNFGPQIKNSVKMHPLAGQDKITEGLIAVLNAVEPCQSFRVWATA